MRYIVTFKSVGLTVEPIKVDADDVDLEDDDEGKPVAFNFTKGEISVAWVPFSNVLAIYPN